MRIRFRLNLIIFSFLLSLSPCLTARPATEDPDLISLLKNAVPRELLPSDFSNELKPSTTTWGGRLETVGIRFTKPRPRASIEFRLHAYFNLTRPIHEIYETDISDPLGSDQIMARDLGIGEPSVHYQRRQPSEAPFDITAQIVSVYWGTYKITVGVYDYNRSNGQDFSHYDAGQLARLLAKTTLDNMRGGGGGNVPDEEAFTPTMSQAEWERRKADVARHARHDGDPLKEGYIGLIVADSGDYEIYDYSGRRKTGDASRRAVGPNGRVYQRIRIGDVVRTGRDGLVRIQMADRDEKRNAGPSVINIAPDTDMTFNKFLVNFEDTGRGRESVIDLIKGTIGAFFKGWGQNSSVSVRTGVTVCGIRGTEVLISYDPHAERVDAHVIEGHMDVSNSATGQTRSLTDNQKLTVDNGQVGAVQPMSQAEWDSLLERHGLGMLAPSVAKPVARPAAAYAIPEIQATIADVRFFESGTNGVPYGQRTYLNRFRTDSRIIVWEILFMLPAPGRRVDCAIDAVWTGPDGSELTRQTAPGYVTATSTSRYMNMGWGSNEPGNWMPGTHTVDFFYKGRKIASGSFEIVEAATPPPAAAYAIPEIQATVKELKFYESDFSQVPNEERVYRTLFAKNATRYVNWELRLTHPAPGQRTEFSIEAVWTAPDGSEFARQTLSAFVEGAWTDSYHSFSRGSQEPGHWSPGTYTVLIFIEDREIAAGTFKVYE